MELAVCRHCTVVPHVVAMLLRVSPELTLRVPPVDGQAAPCHLLCNSLQFVRLCVAQAEVMFSLSDSNDDARHPTHEPMLGGMTDSKDESMV